MGVDEFFVLRRAEEERLRAARAKTPAQKRAHLDMAALFQQKALLIRQ